VIALIVLLNNSCAKTILNLKTKNARELKVFEKDERKVVYIGMTHIAKPRYYEQVKN
jgi:hypothetical protein